MSDLDDLRRALAAIVAEVRADVAARRDPAAVGAEARIRAAADRARARGAASAVTHAEHDALEQLARVVSVHRARRRVSRQPAPPRAPVAPAPRHGALRTRPTITGNMDVRPEARASGLALTWGEEARVATWEVRVSERATRSRDYVVRETLTLSAETRAVELTLGEDALRVHVLGRGRDGRLLRRAMVSGLTLESWDERWERRATAS